MRGMTDGRLRDLRRREDAWSMRRLNAEEVYGQDSPEERRALERATDCAAEAQIVDDYLERGIE